MCIPLSVLLVWLIVKVSVSSLELNEVNNYFSMRFTLLQSHVLYQWDILLCPNETGNRVITFQIFIYSSKSISSPSRQSPSDTIHLCQRFFQPLKQLLKSISGMAFNTFFDLAFISSIELKLCPRSDLLSLLNSHTSHGAKSGEYTVRNVCNFSIQVYIKFPICLLNLLHLVILVYSGILNFLSVH